ncbi:uncharacterized protein LOC118203737 isoform X3 [Stegodyphus dumicola]|uniref:uncharacterized protein LOC118203737 isoform X3 n=1 Tax=Stegodyphus dumicola TaxID=202533 RepID=UPI0015AD9D3D|nr:uncharacterized protein LOC118203737 isoform X3 [Stegodyphus dumicola]
MYYNRSHSPGPFFEGRCSSGRGHSYNNYISDIISSLPPRNPTFQRVINSDFGRQERSRSPVRDYTGTRLSNFRPISAALSGDTSPVLRRRDFSTVSSQALSESRSSPINWLNSDDYSYNNSKPRSYYDFPSSNSRYSSYTSPIRRPQRTDYSDYLRPVLQARPMLKSNFVPRSRAERENAGMPIVRERKLIKFREITNDILNKVRRKISWDLDEEIDSPLINEMRKLNPELSDDKIVNEKTRSRESSLTRFGSRDYLSNTRGSSPAAGSPRASASRRLSDDHTLEPRSPSCSRRFSSPKTTIARRASRENSFDALDSAKTAPEFRDPPIPPPRKKSFSSAHKVKKSRKSSLDDLDEKSLNHSIIADEIKRQQGASNLQRLLSLADSSKALERPESITQNEVTCLEHRRSSEDQKSNEVSPSVNSNLVSADSTVDNILTHPRRRRRLHCISNDSSDQNVEESRSRCRSRARSRVRDDSLPQTVSAEVTVNDVSYPINRMHRKSVKYKADNLTPVPISNESVTPSIQNCEVSPVIKDIKSSITNKKDNSRHPGLEDLKLKTNIITISNKMDTNLKSPVSPLNNKMNAGKEHKSNDKILDVKSTVDKNQKVINKYDSPLNSTSNLHKIKNKKITTGSSYADEIADKNIIGKCEEKSDMSERTKFLSKAESNLDKVNNKKVVNASFIEEKISHEAKRKGQTSHKQLLQTNIEPKLTKIKEKKIPHASISEKSASKETEGIIKSSKTNTNKIATPLDSQSKESEEVIVVCKLPQPKGKVEKAKFPGHNASNFYKNIPVDQDIVVSIVKKDDVVGSVHICEKNKSRHENSSAVLPIIPVKQAFPFSEPIRESQSGSSEICDIQPKAKNSSSTAGRRDNENNELHVTHTVVLKPKIQKKDLSKQVKFEPQKNISAVRLNSIPDVIQTTINVNMRSDVKPDIASQAKQTTVHSNIPEDQLKPDKSFVLPNIKENIVNNEVVSTAAPKDISNEPNDRKCFKGLPNITKSDISLSKERNHKAAGASILSQDVAVADAESVTTKTILQPSVCKTHTDKDLVKMQNTILTKPDILTCTNESKASQKDHAIGSNAAVPNKEKEELLEQNKTECPKSDKNISKSYNKAREETHLKLTPNLARKNAENSKTCYKRSATTPDVNAVLEERRPSYSKSDSLLSGNTHDEKSCKKFDHVMPNSNDAPTALLSKEVSCTESKGKDNLISPTDIKFDKNGKIPISRPDDKHMERNSALEESRRTQNLLKPSLAVESKTLTENEPLVKQEQILKNHVVENSLNKLSPASKYEEISKDADSVKSAKVDAKEGKVSENAESEIRNIAQRIDDSSAVRIKTVSATTKENVFSLVNLPTCEMQSICQDVNFDKIKLSKNSAPTSNIQLVSDNKSVEKDVSAVIPPVSEKLHSALKPENVRDEDMIKKVPETNSLENLKTSFTLQLAFNESNVARTLDVDTKSEARKLPESSNTDIMQVGNKISSHLLKDENSNLLISKTLEGGILQEISKPDVIGSHKELKDDAIRNKELSTELTSKENICTAGSKLHSSHLNDFEANNIVFPKLSSSFESSLTNKLSDQENLPNSISKQTDTREKKGDILNYSKINKARSADDTDFKSEVDLEKKKLGSANIIHQSFAESQNNLSDSKSFFHVPEPSIKGAKYSVNTNSSVEAVNDSMNFGKKAVKCPPDSNCGNLTDRENKVMSDATSETEGNISNGISKDSIICTSDNYMKIKKTLSQKGELEASDLVNSTTSVSNKKFLEKTETESVKKTDANGNETELINENYPSLTNKAKEVKLLPRSPPPVRIGLFIKSDPEPIPESSSSSEDSSDLSDDDDTSAIRQSSAQLSNHCEAQGNGKSPDRDEKSRTRSQTSNASIYSSLSSSTTCTTFSTSSLEDEGKSPTKESTPKTLRFRKYEIDDFVFLKLLGKGSFGKVLLAELKGHDMYFAIKCLKKDVVLEDDDVESTMIERRVLALGTQHPYMCKLYCTFQTKSYLFFVMEYLNGGDLMFHIQQSKKFPEQRAMFYGAEIVSALKFLHKRGIVYRDIKLDNVMLDEQGHVRLVDFGMCQCRIYKEECMPFNFCGTPQYICPEIILGQKYNQSVDWWSFGVLLYEMITGRSPFYGTDEDELFWSICNEEPPYPRYLSKEARHILGLLLVKSPSKRLGMPSCPAGDIKDHAFFSTINWDKLEKKQIPPPFKPKVLNACDTSNFDHNFTMDSATLSPVDSEILASMDQEQFKGFSYTNPHITG